MLLQLLQLLVNLCSKRRHFFMFFSSPIGLRCFPKDERFGWLHAIGPIALGNPNQWLLVYETLKIKSCFSHTKNIWFCTIFSLNVSSKFRLPRVWSDSSRWKQGGWRGFNCFWEETTPCRGILTSASLFSRCRSFIHRQREEAKLNFSHFKKFWVFFFGKTKAKKLFHCLGCFVKEVSEKAAVCFNK